MNKSQQRAIVRQATEADIERMINIHDICFPPPFPTDIRWTPETLRTALANFPEGQLIAEVDGHAAGHIISNRVSEALYLSHPPLLEFAGKNWCNYDAVGNTMWILEIAVDPGFSGRGAARALVEGCQQVVFKVEGLFRFGGGARIPGYAKWKKEHGGPPEEYCNRVVAGEIFDPVLGPFLKFGVRFDCVVPNYITDPDSHDFGASVVWERK